jgi:ADP-ribosylglycohydrolase
VNRTAGDARRHDRIAGALLGVHADDSLGATLEFMPWQAIRARYPDGLRDIVGGGPFGWPAGHATDDSDLTRAVLLAYLAPGHADIVRAAADNMLAWLDGDWPGREPGSRPRDIGGATHHGLERYRHCGDPRAAGAGPGDRYVYQGHLAPGLHAPRPDGSGRKRLPVRCIPTALAVTDRSRRIRESIEISAITHDDQRATVACAAYNEITAALLRETPAEQVISAGLAAARELGCSAVADAIDRGCRIQPAAIAATGIIPFDVD